MNSLLLLAAHMLGDFVTQNDWMAANKFRSSLVRTVHVAVYTAGFVPFLMLTPIGLGRGVGFLACVFVAHWVTDCRRWASGEKWPPKPIVVDQTLHLIQLAVFGRMFGL